MTTQQSTTDLEGRGTLIVIPAYNEEASIGQTLDGLRPLNDVAVIVVNDGSTDHTHRVARSRGVLVIDLPFNIGVGAALQTGFLYAVRNGYGRVVQMDADNQHGATDVPCLLHALDAGADLAIGTRFGAASDDAAEYHVGRVRRLAMRSMLSMVRWSTGNRFTDATSGFRAFSTRLVHHWAEEFPVDYLSDTVEALVNACADGFIAVEVPVTMKARAAGLPSTRGIKLIYHYIRVAIVVTNTGWARRRQLHSLTDTAVPS